MEAAWIWAITFCLGISTLLNRTCPRSSPLWPLAATLTWFAVAKAGGPPQPDPTLVALESRRIAAIERLSPSVLAVFARGGENAEANGGSGVIISADGFALTNFHVLQGGGVAFRCGSGDGRLHDAILAGIDPVGDLALLKLIGDGPFRPAAIGDSDRARPGQTVLALGNPFLLATDFRPTASLGIVSGVSRYQYPAGTMLEYTDCIQVDAAINPGNSGGPLFDLEGALLGINGRISLEKRGRVNVGVAYAISIRQASHFLDQLKGGLVVDHASLGATVAADAEGRAVVDRTRPSSDVARLGLAPGDEVVSLAGRAISSPNELKNMLGTLPSGWRVELTFRRAGKRATIFPRLEGSLAAARANGGDNREPIGADKLNLPEHLRPFFEARPGFANYAFNRAELDRLLGGLTARADFAADTGPWRLMLADETGAEVTVVLGDERSTWSTAKETFTLSEAERDRAAPPGTGGLLVAMDQWRRFLVRPRNSFSALAYAGSMLDVEDRYLAVASEREGIRTLWLLDPKTGSLGGMDCEAELDSVPCSVRFGAERPISSNDERALPGRWEVRRAGRRIGVYETRKVELSR